MPLSARPSAVFRPLSATALWTLVWVVLAASAWAEPRLPGVATAQLDDAAKGRLLLEELNCVACHAAPSGVELKAKQAPRLADVAQRIHPDYLESFVRDPHATKPGTTMPDLLAALPAEARAATAKQLAHFLLSLQPTSFAPQAPDAVAAAQGEKLFHARGCAACHSPRDADGRETLPATSVPLGALERKYDLRGLTDFLRQPHRTRPSGRMPDLRLPPRELECIAHYLLRGTQVPGHLSYMMYRGQVWEGIGHDAVEPERAGMVDDFSLGQVGRIHQHMAIRFEGWVDLPSEGEYRFFLKANGATLTVDGREVATLAPKDRRGTQDFDGKATLKAGKHRIRLDYYHTGREPSLSFEVAGPGLPRQTIGPTRLSVAEQPIAGFVRPTVDAQLAAAGRAKFSQLGCANCHDDLSAPKSIAASALTQVQPIRGCLGDAPAAGARFDLSPEQIGQLRAALKPGVLVQPLGDAQTLQGELARFNCLACHERRGLGGIAPERNALFTSTAPALGDQGRLPPPLSDVGAKLTAAGLEGALVRGLRPRPYVETIMPQFGEANVRPLIALLGRVDKLEAATLPKVGDLLESKNAGYEMVGEKGFSCIACHDFNGQKSAGAGALDLVDATTRLQKNWFHLYMRSPQRFHPGIIMPSYWPGGQSLRPDVLGGDTGRQIEALWTYLEGGTRARNPLGLSRQSKELRVTDVAEMARGRSGIGYRAIAVGYPGRLSLAFDSEEMALRQLWKGEFANVDHGSFQPRAMDTLVAFPAGVPFHRLKSLDDPWPAKGKTTYGFPQTLGYQFRGYDLDALRHPTFHYEYGEVKVDDVFEDVTSKDGHAFFRRTLRFTAPAGTAPFYFRAACGTKVVAVGPQAYQADKLTIRVLGTQPGQVREGELLLPLAPPAGTSTLILEYQW